MTNQEAFLVGRALGLAEGGWWNDALDALVDCPRPLFERVEGFLPIAESKRALHISIQSWAAEQGLVVPTHDEDIFGNYGPSPWTIDQN